MWNVITLKLLGSMLVGASLATILARKIKAPHIVLYIITGLLLSQYENLFLSGQSLSATDSAVDLISELGIALLLFLVGMELSLNKIRDVGKESLVIGLIQMLVCAGLGIGLGLALNFSLIESMYIGVALSFSSTVIVVKFLGEKGHLNSLYGKVSIGILLLQDLVVIIALTIAGQFGDGSPTTAMSLSSDLVSSLAGAMGLFASAYLGAKHGLSRIMSWASSSTETLMIWSLTWCFVFVGLSDVLGLSHELGAFAAGVSLAQFPLSNGLKQRTHPLVNFFVAIFFVALGMEIDVSYILVDWKACVAFALFATAGKCLIFLLLLRTRRFSERTSALVALTMCQMSEFTFVFLAIAGKTGQVGERAIATMSLGGVISFILSAFLISKNVKIWTYLSHRRPLLSLNFKFKKLKGEFPKDHRKNHIIVIGMNSLGREICFRLSQNGHRALAIDNDPKKLALLPCETMVGYADYSSLLKDASAAKSRLVISTLRIEDINKSLIYRCKQLKVPIAIHGFDSSVLGELKGLGADYIIDSKSSWLGRLRKELREKGVQFV